MDSNKDGIGDLPGLISKIDYIASLGGNAIWLSPIYTSPQADFGYDITDYENIDPIYGTLSDFDKLIKLAHSKGIRIIMDYVPNHTSDQHEWFKESKSSKDNPKRDWYIWAKGKGNSPPNNWLSVFGGSAWEYDANTSEYYLHSFHKGQPDLNWSNPNVVEKMLNVLRFWLDRGVNGFRVDAPYHIFKNQKLLDEPLNPKFIQGKDEEYKKNKHIYTAWLPESFAMMTKFADVIQEYDHRFMVSEAWGTMDDLVKLYKTVGWKYYAPFNFSLLKLPWKADIHKKYIDAYDKKLGDEYMPCYVIGNHDKSRTVTRIGEPQARVAAMLELTLRGIQFIYYGEEIGMSDTKIPKKLIKDPFEILSPGLGLGRDPQRTPMQWNKDSNAGFSAISPWLPINSNFKKINTEVENKDPNSMLNLYKLLIKLHKHHKALYDGEYIPQKQLAKNVFAFKRKSQDEEVLVILNFDNKKKNISMPYSGRVIANTLNVPKPNTNINLENYELKPNEGLLLLLKK